VHTTYDPFSLYLHVQPVGLFLHVRPNGLYLYGTALPLMIERVLLDSTGDQSVSIRGQTVAYLLFVIFFAALANFCLNVFLQRWLILVVMSCMDLFYK
jgi:hypothetical protein